MATQRWRPLRCTPPKTPSKAPTMLKFSLPNGKRHSLLGRDRIVTIEWQGPASVKGARPFRTAQPSAILPPLLPNDPGPQSFWATCDARSPGRVMELAHGLADAKQAVRAPINLHAV